MSQDRAVGAVSVIRWRDIHFRHQDAAALCDIRIPFLQEGEGGGDGWKCRVGLG